MSTEAIRFEINKELESFSEHALHDLLLFLQELKRGTAVDIESLTTQVMEEDKELLKKLSDD